MASESESIVEMGEYEAKRVTLRNPGNYSGLVRVYRAGVRMLMEKGENETKSFGRWQRGAGPTFSLPIWEAIRPATPQNHAGLCRVTVVQLIPAYYPHLLEAL